MCASGTRVPLAHQNHDLSSSLNNVLIRVHSVGVFDRADQLPSIHLLNLDLKSGKATR